jgi:hypothetical protein
MGAACEVGWDAMVPFIEVMVVLWTDPAMNRALPFSGVIWNANHNYHITSLNGSNGCVKAKDLRF